MLKTETMLKPGQIIYTGPNVGCREIYHQDRVKECIGTDDFGDGDTGHKVLTENGTVVGVMAKSGIFWVVRTYCNEGPAAERSLSEQKEVVKANSEKWLAELEEADKAPRRRKKKGA